MTELLRLVWSSKALLRAGLTSKLNQVTEVLVQMSFEISMAGDIIASLGNTLTGKEKKILTEFPYM